MVEKILLDTMPQSHSVLSCVIKKQIAPGSNFRKIILQLAYLVRYILPLLQLQGR